MRTARKEPTVAPLAALALSTVALLGTAPVAAGQATIRTQAELSRFAEDTSYDGMMEYLGRLQGASTEMRLGIYGQSREGRALPVAIFSRPAATRPWEAWALGKPILVLATNVHGGERVLRESVLIRARELSTPGTLMNDALDELTILVVPQINPDGFSALPVPTRGNLWGVDLNRDYMKLEQPEIQAYVQDILLAWAPHLVVDGHSGGAQPYNLNYQCPSHSTPDPRITTLCDERIFPAVQRRLASEGYAAWYYFRGNETRWDVGGPEPRVGRNYGGFANTIAILFESPDGQRGHGRGPKRAPRLPGGHRVGDGESGPPAQHGPRGPAGGDCPGRRSYGRRGYRGGVRAGALPGRVFARERAARRPPDPGDRE